MGSAPDQTFLKCKKIAVVGAGPAGLAAAKYFVAENAFDKITLFEQRGNVGGVWNYTPEARMDSNFSVPQTNVQAAIEEPIFQEQRQGLLTDETRNEGKANGAPEKTKEGVTTFVSPMYEQLETNIPRSLMRFADQPFPDDVQLFPKHRDVLEYLEKYAEDIKHLIQFNTQVVLVDLLDGHEQGKGVEADQWKVKTRNFATGEEKEEIYDAVVVASGHFNLPYIPDIPGLKEWNERYPGTITHSKYYRRPEDFKDKTVVVIGTSASGLDISTQLTTHASTPIYLSYKTNPPADAHPLKKPIPTISHLDPTHQTIHFTGGDALKLVGPVHLLFATGYLYALPFLSRRLQATLHDPTGARIQQTYKHLLYTAHPTLAFLALPQRIIPFPLAQAQAAVLARLYAGRLPLPPLAAMHAWERDTLARTDGDAAAFHLLPFPMDADYINEMADWAETAETAEADADGANKGKGTGKPPPRWGSWEYWVRERVPELKRAFVERGEARHGVRRVGELDDGSLGLPLPEGARDPDELL